MRILDIEAYASKKIFDFAEIRGVSVDKELGMVILTDLASHQQFIAIFISSGTHITVWAGKPDGNSCFSDASIPIFIDEFTQIRLKPELR